MGMRVEKQGWRGDQQYYVESTPLKLPNTVVRILTVAGIGDSEFLMVERIVSLA